RIRHGQESSPSGDPGGITGIAKDTRSRQSGHDLLEEFQTFPAKTVFELHKAGGVAARPGQAVDKPCADRISDTHEHDRQDARGLLQRTLTVPLARRTSGASVTNSAAYWRSRSTSFSPQRVFIRTLRSLRPSCCRTCRNASTRA